MTPEEASVTLSRDFIESSMEPKMIEQQMKLYLSGIISRATLHENLQKGEIVRAVLDLFGKALPASGGDDETLLARQEALYLLTRDSGAWAESRVRLCGACGIDPNALPSAA